ncbi:hypothetical protein OHB01_12025 [Microbispora hainanensis]|uniref:Uncharacterized protein n=1 Tax=Microbispora hainanensis TaxID=568844 RepID=A0ABZ1SMN1_9ACTN|nr:MULTISPECIES: hypothetical protein [Microbispora]NJP26561.1 hypothetical protein [Microbispora sp. CL1-1]
MRLALDGEALGVRTGHVIGGRLRGNGDPEHAGDQCGEQDQASHRC